MNFKMKSKINHRESNPENKSQRKKGTNEVQNVVASGDTKNEQGKKINIEHMPVNSDNHADHDKKEFVLSEKLYGLQNEHLNIEDVKEFIKRLKEDIAFLTIPEHSVVFKLIDKHAGEQLIDSPEEKRNINGSASRNSTCMSEDKPEPCNTSVYSGRPSSEGSGSGEMCKKFITNRRGRWNLKL